MNYKISAIVVFISLSIWAGYILLLKNKHKLSFEQYSHLFAYGPLVFIQSKEKYKSITTNEMWSMSVLLIVVIAFFLTGIYLSAK